MSIFASLWFTQSRLKIKTKITEVSKHFFFLNKEQINTVVGKSISVIFNLSISHKMNTIKLIGKFNLFQLIISSLGQEKLQMTTRLMIQLTHGCFLWNIPRWHSLLICLLEMLSNAPWNFPRNATPLLPLFILEAAEEQLVWKLTERLLRLQGTILAEKLFGKLFTLCLICKGTNCNWQVQMWIGKHTHGPGSCVKVPTGNKLSEIC